MKRTSVIVEPVELISVTVFLKNLSFTPKEMICWTFSALLAVALKVADRVSPLEVLVSEVPEMVPVLPFSALALAVCWAPLLVKPTAQRSSGEPGRK